MSKFVDYDPLTGVETWADSTYGDHRHQVHYRQDVEPILELTNYERINGLCDTQDIKKKDVPRLYARIPPTLILKLKYQHGLNVFSSDPTERRKAFETIEREYPKVKTTDMKLYGGRRKV